MTSSDPASQTLRRLLGGALVLLVLLIGAPALRVGIASHQAYAQGLAAEAAGDVPSAILHHRHAMQWYLPVGAADGAAALRLVALGDEAQARGDLQVALLAWRSARSALLVTRHFWVPQADLLPQLHTRIASAMAQQTGVPEDATRFGEQLAAWQDGRPAPAFVALSGLLFIGWLAAIGLTIARAVSPDGRVNVPRLIRGIVVAGALFGIWLALVRFL